MTRQAHRTVVLYENGVEICKGSATRIAAMLYNPRNSEQQADRSRLVAKLAKGQHVDLDLNDNQYRIEVVNTPPISSVEQYEKAKSLYRRNNKEASKSAKECRKHKKGSPDWMESHITMLKAQAGAKIAKEWMQKYSDGDMTDNHKTNKG